MKLRQHGYRRRMRASKRGYIVGLTIAALATEKQQLREALVQATATAEATHAFNLGIAVHAKHIALANFETMRANLARWSKFEDGAKVSRKGNG